MSKTEMPSRGSWRFAPTTLLLAVGLVLIALSFVWPKLSNGRSSWTDEKAEAYQAASAEVHRLSMQMVGTAPEDQTRARHDELADAQTMYASLRAELDEVRSRPARIATILRYTGIMFALAGAAVVVVKRLGD